MLKGNDPRLEFLESLQYYWQCPITNVIMQDPVLTSDGITYERKASTEWLVKSKTSPVSNLPLDTNLLIPNIAFRNMIQKFKNAPSFLKKSKIEAKIYQQESYLEKARQKDQLIKTLQQQILQLKKQIEFLQQKVIKFEKQNSIFRLKILRTNPQNQQNSKIEQNKENNKNTHNNQQVHQIKENNKSQMQVSLALFKFSQQGELRDNEQYLKMLCSKDQKFKSNYFIKQRINGVNYHFLEHWNIKINMGQFVQFNWSTLIKINLKKCQTDDQGWNIFSKNENFFVNLQKIYIVGNRIKSTSSNQLSQFKELKIIWFYHGIYSNPLTIESKKILESYNKLNNPLKWIVSNQNDRERSQQWDQIHNEKKLYS